MDKDDKATSQEPEQVEVETELPEKDDLIEEELDEASGGVSYSYYTSSSNFNPNFAIGGVRGPGPVGPGGTGG